MNAITLYQPWASLIACGLKTTETRHWPPKPGHVGRRMAIHAGRQAITTPRRLNTETWDAIAALYGPDWPNEMPRGAVVATALLAGFYRVEQKNGSHLKLSGYPAPTPTINPDPYGDFTTGRWIWLFTDIESIDPPQPARGTLGIWNWQPQPKEAPAQQPITQL